MLPTENGIFRHNMIIFLCAKNSSTVLKKSITNSNLAKSGLLEMNGRKRSNDLKNFTKLELEKEIENLNAEEQKIDKIIEQQEIELKYLTEDTVWFEIPITI